MRAAAAMLADSSIADESPPPSEPPSEPEPEPQGEQQPASVAEGVPPGAALVPTNTLPARSYSGEEVSVMYHGTDSRAAQLIASSQRFLPSARGLLGRGIYMTRTRQKAEGYRTHHPGAGMVGSEERNLPLPNGEEDPGCILRFRVELGACKKMSRDCPVSELESWHDTAVEELDRTPSFDVAAMGVRTLSGSGSIRYNSAYSAGCSCCPE